MTKDDVRAAAKRLVEFHERFAPTFRKDQAQDNAYTYIKGLMICPERQEYHQIPPRRGRLGPSWRGLGPSGEGRAGRRQGPSRTASDSRRP